MTAVHVLYDNLSRPEYLDLIREEIKQVPEEDGPWMQWQKSSFTNLRKLDLFMRESQRFNPPTLLSIHRVTLQSHELSDGTELLCGSHISMPVNAIQNEPDVTPKAKVFDALRYFKLRQQDGETYLHPFPQPRIRS